MYLFECEATLEARLFAPKMRRDITESLPALGRLAAATPYV
jgi:hypothetical protein